MPNSKRAIALGFFDGVHIGHAALLNKTKQRAAEIGAMPSVLSFDVHPDTLVFGKEVPLINSAIGREEIIRRCFGIDNVVFIHFNQHVMRMPWRDFADSVIDELQAAWIVVGHDFSFGYRGEGTPEKLRDYCAGRGVGCDVIEAVTLDGTINMFFPDGVLVPRHGVYAARVFLENGENYMAVTNVGVRPTVSEGNRVSVESHLLDYEGNLYGRQARVEFHAFLREETRFPDIETLSAQIRRDAEAARAWFAAHPEA